MSEQQANQIPSANLQRVLEKLTVLQEKLLAKDPQMPQHLRESHSLLQQFPETVWLLTDDKIKLLLDAAQAYTQVTIVKQAAAKATSGRGGSSRGRVNVDEL